MASANLLASSYTPRGPIGLTLPQYASDCGCSSGSPYTSDVDASTKVARLARGQTERVVCPEGPDLECRNREVEVVDWARRAGPVQHEVQGAVEVDVVGDVLLDETKVAPGEVGDVGQVARQEVVDPDDRIPFVEQRIREVGADEARGSGDDGRFRHRVTRLVTVDLVQYACRWKKPRTTVSHMILKSSLTDQFSM